MIDGTIIRSVTYAVTNLSAEQANADQLPARSLGDRKSVLSEGRGDD